MCLNPCPPRCAWFPWEVGTCGEAVGHTTVSPTSVSTGKTYLSGRFLHRWTCRRERVQGLMIRFLKKSLGFSENISLGRLKGGGLTASRAASVPQVISVLGEPVKGYGEVTRRGRRQHVRYCASRASGKLGVVSERRELQLCSLVPDSFIEYVKDGLKHMRVKFYIQGSEPGKQGTVHLEVKEVCSRGLGGAGRKPCDRSHTWKCVCFSEPRNWRV